MREWLRWLRTLERPCNTCIEDVNKGAKKMVIGEATNVSVIKTKLLKWTMPCKHHWIMTIINQVINKA